ncbi:YbfB/YjiJ family MFS transporter [Methylobacterium sp. J-030]|uniref:YbfB/YjiJ family MFS transporter n=1 Tax=Methylobacterium sp. J-030 TaxID=2836627 RepID=UPI001FBAD12C|nr:YbfB/YjiJ family MFS transporter [Methylobacterium sp. J-030]MCJ2069477.1 YbfB/YjiJ family MFS transporter [Methylobacterium sp. J-030]
MNGSAAPLPVAGEAGGRLPSPALAAGFLTLAVAIGIGRFVYTPILPAMADGLGLTRAQTGLIGSANFAGYLAGALAAAHPLLLRGRRLWLGGALATCVATLMAMGGCATLAAFVTLRFVGGAASALGFVLATTLVMDRLTRTGRSDGAALHYAGVGSGIALSAAVVSVAREAGCDWRALWVISGVLALGLAGPILWLIPGAPPAASPAPADAAAAPSITRLVVAYGLFGFGYVITATFVVAIVRTAPHLAAAEAYVWLCVGLAAAPSVALWGRVERRLGFRTSFALACLVEASGVLVSVLTAQVPGLLYAALALGGTFVALTWLGIDGARRLRAGNRQRIVAVMMAAFGTGQVIGPVAAGVLADLTGSFTVPSLAAAAALLIAAALVLSLPGAVAADREPAALTPPRRRSPARSRDSRRGSGAS